MGDESFRDATLSELETHGGVTPVPVVEPEFKTTLTPEQLDAAQAEVAGRSFSGRNPEFGKMINCQVCGRRHRTIDVTYREIIDEENGVKFGTQLMTLVNKCEQKFTHSGHDKDGRKYSQYREEQDKDGNTTTVPDYRTAIHPDSKPTIKQVVGAAQFNKKRFHPHPSKTKLLFIEAVRFVFQGWELQFNENIERMEDEDFRTKLEEAYKKDAQNMLQRARLKAARALHRAGHRLQWGVKQERKK